MKWVKALDLENWAATIPARTSFPGLIADLIRASVVDIRSFRFPHGDKGQIRGFDGSLEAESATTYIPKGRSIWEFGVSKGAVSKAESDYSKRVKAIPSDERSNLTFVFVSLQTWDNPKVKLDDWIKEKRDKNEWADVRYLDGVSLEAWLDECPAVAAKFARDLGKAPLTGARSTDEFWDEYSSRFEPTLSEEVLLCDREDQATALMPKLVNDSGTIQLAADSPDEVIAFVIAAIRKAEHEERIFLEARTIVIDNEEAARAFSGRKNLTFLPRAQASHLAGMLGKSGPTLVAFGGDQPKRQFEKLERPSSSSMGTALTTMGFSKDEGYAIARSCGRSVTILARLKAAGTVSQPEWLANGMDIIPALLAGGWIDTSSPDKDIVCQLASGVDYDTFEAKLRPLTRLQDPPIDRIQDVWNIRAPVDAFIYLGHLIGSEDLNRFRKALKQVFSSLDRPPIDSNELFQLKKQNPGGYSDWLRDGLATTLLQIATLNDQAELVISGSSPQAFVDELVNGLPGLSNDYRLIESLENQLPILAEAAPDPLLSALEHLLEGDDKALLGIFKEEESLLSPTSNHTHLLWALELIAWDPARLNRTALVLAQLAKIDPGGRLSNRPINSLREIFISWSPNTNASVVQRTGALSLIIEHVPEIAWELLIKLFPRSRDTSSPTMAPRYREFGASDREVLTYAVVWESQRQIITLALGIAEDNPDRLIDIINAFSDFEPDLRESSLNIIDVYLASGHEENQIRVWRALCDEANKNKRFPNADWSLSETDLDKLNLIIEKNRPENIIPNITWLFDDWQPVISGNFDEDDDKVNEARDEAIAKLTAAHGLNGILDLSESVKLPQFIASSLINICDDPNEVGQLITLAERRSSNQNHFVSVISGNAARKFKNRWIKIFEKLIDKGLVKKQSIAQHLLMWPDDKATWDIASKAGPEVEKEYWQKKNPHLLNADSDGIEYSINQYIRFNNSVGAIESIYRHPKKIPVSLLLEIMISSIKELNSNNKVNSTMLSYYLKHIFEYLDQHIDVSDDEVAKLEYAYFPLIERDRDSLVIHRMMATNPEFYVSVLCDVFRANSEIENASPEQDQARARASYRLLTSFKTIPGEEKGVIELSQLRNWITKVQTLSIDLDREVIANQYIGQLLANSPVDESNNSWPISVIQMLIEELKSEDIEKGIMIERFNMRGVYTKALYEGGKQERELAEQYRDWAKLASNHPRTASLLLKISSRWDADADQADIQAQQDKMKD